MLESAIRAEWGVGSGIKYWFKGGDTDSKKVTAEFRDGVLKVHLPTTEIVKTKALQVKVQ
jgi:HSP20 family protein